jgi:hypothetical protein
VLLTLRSLSSPATSLKFSYLLTVS